MRHFLHSRSLTLVQDEPSSWSLDEIFGHLPPDDGESLQACSLVAKPWVSPSQSRLFSSVIVTESNYRSWKDGVSYANAELFSHVRSLRYFIRWSRMIPDCGPLPIGDLFDYLPLFRHLQHLSLCSTRIKSDISEQPEAFSVFRHTLSSLTFHTLILISPGLASTIDYFPNVRDLKVTDPIWEADHQQAPPLSRPLRGRLSIEMCGYQVLSTFADRFSGLPEVEYDELLILGNFHPTSSTSHYQRIIDTCGEEPQAPGVG